MSAQFAFDFLNLFYGIFIQAASEKIMLELITNTNDHKLASLMKSP
jgi:hypothetical protein